MHLKTTKIKLKKADKQDLELVRNIGRNTFLETFSAENSAENMIKYLVEKFSETQIQSEISNPLSTFYLAVLENNVIGYLKLNEGEAQTENKTKNSIEIERIYVLKDYQGNKIGQMLYETALEFAIEKKVDFIWLGVWEENKNAIRFYEKNGFEKFDQHLFVLGEDQQTDILMRKFIR